MSNCVQCGNALDSLSVNKGTRSAHNKGRIQQTVIVFFSSMESSSFLKQCSNRRCRNTIFHSNPLEPDTAASVIQAAHMDPSILLHLPNNMVNYTTMRTTQNASNVPTVLTVPHNSSHLLPPRPPEEPITREHIIALLQRPNGGIYCARETCKTVKGDRTKGHKECTDLFCRKCCQEAALDAVRKGLHRSICQERKHRVAHLMPMGSQALAATSISILPSTLPTLAGDLTDPVPNILPPRAPAVSQVPAPGLQTGHTILEGSDRAITQQHIVIPQATQISGSPGPATQAAPTMVNSAPMQRAAPISYHAMPIATMWQPTTPAWLEARQIAAKEDDRRTNVKQASLESRQQKMMQVTAIAWYLVRHF